jgi:AcrR family transcriptional regulator
MPLRRDQIVTAAVRCFAEKGFSGTTTRAIAGAARVSEALVFRHFPTKKSLYRAIVGRKLASLSAGAFPEREALAGDDRAVLTALGEMMVRRIEADPGFLRLLTFSCLERNPLARMFFEAHGRSMFSWLAAYLDGRIEKRAMRRMDAEVAARAFLGMVFHHLHVKHVMGLPVGPAPSLSRVPVWVEVFLGGMRA